LYRESGFETVLAAGVFFLVVLQVDCGGPLSLCCPIGCIYKRGTLATKGVSLGHQGFGTWVTACVGLVWTKK